MCMTLPSLKMGDSMQEVLATASAGSGRTALPADSPAGLGLASGALLEPWFSRLHGRFGEQRIFDRQTRPGRADRGLPLPTK